jgi:type IV pilus assembly protein PilP
MRVLRTLLIASLGIAVLACSSEPAPAPAAQAKATRAPAAAPPTQVVEEMPDVEYRYDPTGKPDPFRSFVRLQEELDEGVTTPLERFDLSQLQVTAIIWSSERPRALIRDPAGKGYIVSAGTPIGKNKGRVVSIEDNLVLVKETYVDFRDRATTKEVEMRLYESQGG